MTRSLFRATIATLALAAAVTGCDNPSYPAPASTGNWPPASSTPFAADLPRDAYLAGMVQQGNIVYVIGGADTNSKASGRVRAFGLTSRTWSEKAPMITPRFNLALMTIGNRIVALGGRNDAAGTVPEQNRYEVYDIAADAWAAYPRVTEKGFDGTYGTYMAELDGKIYAAATSSSNDGGVDTMIALVVIDGETISRSASAPLRRLVEPTLVAAQGKIYVIGRTAYESAGINRMYEYDPAAGTFTERSAPRHNERGYANCCYYHGGKIFKLNTYEKSANVMEIYTIATDTWSQISLPYPMRNNAIFHPIVTNRSTGEVYFCSTPGLTNGIHFDPRTLAFATR